jgi:hypothetical protein
MNRFATHRKFALVDLCSALEHSKEYSVLVAELQSGYFDDIFATVVLSFQVKVALLVSWQLDQLW